MLSEDLLGLFQSEIEFAIRRTCAHWRIPCQDREDLEIELWLCVLDRDAQVLRSFNRRSSVRTYLYVVLNRAAARWVRRARARRRHETNGGDTYVTDSTNTAYGPPPESALLLRERQDRLSAALGALRPDDLEVLALRLAGHTFEEIARRCGQSVKGVQNRTYRAMRIVRGFVTRATSPKRRGEFGSD